MAFLGIDLGTTNSVAMIYKDKNDTMEVVKVDGIEEILPSVVCILEDEIMIGTEAKNSALIYPENTIFSIKRQMGESYTKEIEGNQYLPEDISGMILKTLKEAAEEQIEGILDEVVITHPAYFNDRQILATKKAGELAGFKQVHLLSEPLASAIEYGYKQGYAQTLLVYDLGGGTFDACVLDVAKDIHGKETFQELADIGDMHLGGDDVDALLVEYMVEQFRLLNHVQLQDLEEETKARVFHKLRQEAEIAKKKLSSTNKVSIKINPLMVEEGVPLNLNLEITKEDLEMLIRPLIEKSREIVEEALMRAGKAPDDLSKVILVGGSTLIPMVKRMVAGTLKEPYRGTDPAKSVAMGAAIYNYLIHLPNSPVKVGQITRKNFGTEAIINTVTGEKAVVPIIPMGSAIPVTITETGFGITSGASAVRAHIYQWEEGKEAERQYIGSLLLEGVDAKAEIAVNYTINTDNLFQVTLKDQVTGKEMQGIFDCKKTLARVPETVSASPLDGAGLNIVFIIDTTTSMDQYIHGVKEKANKFAEILEGKEVAYNLGLIGFGDLLEKEKFKVYKWTKDIKKFQKRMRKIPRTCGGDIPESAFDALETGVQLLNKAPDREKFKTIFILITDAPPHIPTISGKSLEDILDLLEKEEVVLYVVARKDRKSLDAYEPLMALSGGYYSMEEDFSTILDDIAYTIAELIRLPKAEG